MEGGNGDRRLGFSRRHGTGRNRMGMDHCISTYMFIFIGGLGHLGGHFGAFHFFFPFFSSFPIQVFGKKESAASIHSGMYVMKCGERGEIGLYCMALDRSFCSYS